MNDTDERENIGAEHLNLIAQKISSAPRQTTSLETTNRPTMEFLGEIN
ncbi:MAG: hypothetical protein HYR67_01490 [Bacteroidetes bacterium]|nr:hypothetical protein [Bacteroidota bacterium]